MAAVRRRFGWLGPAAASLAWDNAELRSHFITPQLSTTPRTTGRYCPWDGAIEKVTGKKNLPTGRQLIGDCVSWGFASAVDYLQCTEIALRGEQEQFHRVFQPYAYGISRNSPEGGNGRMGRSDGSLGSWMIAAALVHGCLYYKDPDNANVPDYSAAIAKKFGNEKSYWKEFRDTAKDNLIKASARITQESQMVEALLSGYTITCASNWGRSMDLIDGPGKHRVFTGRASWPHQTCAVGICMGDDCPWGVKHEPLVPRLNSWGEDAHGPQGDGPNGMGWETLEMMVRDMQSGDAEYFIVSAIEGIPSRELPKWEDVIPLPR